MTESENHSNLRASAQKLERELRRSLNTFQGYIHALEEDNLDQKQKSFLHKLQNESDRMNRKLNSFNKVFDSTLNVSDNSTSVFKTKETFESIISMLKVDFPEVNVQLLIDSKIKSINHGESSLITDMIHGIAVLLLQHQSSRLIVKVQLSQVIEETQFVDIILEAEHCSISEKDLLNLFQAQKNASTNSNHFVTSLSFELSRKLILLKSIEPQVEKTNSNKLSLIIYDRWKAYSEPESLTPKDQSDDSFENLHLLIVEDDKLNQMVTAMMLKNFGWTCDIANDGIEALELFSPNVHQCVLMDIEMPRMDGYTCTMELRKRFKNKFPIIALSAYGEGERSAMFESEGLDNYLQKPVKKDALYSKIKEAMLHLNE